MTRFLPPAALLSLALTPGRAPAGLPSALKGHEELVYSLAFSRYGTWRGWAGANCSNGRARTSS